MPFDALVLYQATRPSIILSRLKNTGVEEIRFTNEGNERKEARESLPGGFTAAPATTAWIRLPARLLLALIPWAWITRSVPPAAVRLTILSWPGNDNEGEHICGSCVGNAGDVHTEV